jgi:hypothetical protein
MVIDKPKQFLKEVWELIKQQHALNLAYANLINKHANQGERVAHLEGKIRNKDQTIAYFAKGALSEGYKRSTSPYANHLKLAKIIDLLFFANKPEEDKLSFDSWLV